MSMQSFRLSLLVLLFATILGVIAVPETAMAQLTIVPRIGAAPCSFTAASGLGFSASECSGRLLADYMVALTNFLFRFSIVLAVVMVTVGGFQWLLALGNAGKISTAKETIQQAVIGLILALTATLLFSQIDRSFVDLEPIVAGPGAGSGLDCSVYSDNAFRCLAVPSCVWACPSGFSVSSGGVCVKEGERSVEGGPCQNAGEAISPALQNACTELFTKLGSTSLLDWIPGVSSCRRLSVPELYCVAHPNQFAQGRNIQGWAKVCCARDASGWNQQAFLLKDPPDPDQRDWCDDLCNPGTVNTGNLNCFAPGAG